MKKNVLLVEDDPALRMVMREVLKEEFEIEEADNGADGIDKGLNASNDLVILDYHLPKKDGLQVIEAIKLAHPEMPVIVLTGYLSPQTEERFSKLGANKIFPKPFNYRNLLETVRSLTFERGKLAQSDAQPPLSLNERDMLKASLDAIASLAEKVEFLQSVSEKYWVEPSDIGVIRESARCMQSEIQQYYGKLNNTLFNAGEFTSPLLPKASRPCLSGQN